MNRQLLYTEADIGKLKTDALKEHLLSIRPSCEIRTINRKITCEEDLLELLQEDKSDLLVRGIDNPPSSLVWAFDACEKLKVPYVSGGTVGTRAQIGPTYIPGITSKHDLVQYNGVPIYSHLDEAKRLGGTGISSSFAISWSASHLLADAVRILMGKYDLVEYGGRIELKDFFHNEKLEETQKIPEKTPLKTGLFVVYTALIVAIAAAFSQRGPFLPFCYVTLMILVYVISPHKKDILYANALTCGTVAGTVTFAVSVISGRVNMAFGGTGLIGRIGTITNSIFTVTLIICLYAMVFILAAAVEDQFVYRLLRFTLHLNTKGKEYQMKTVDKENLQSKINREKKIIRNTRFSALLFAAWFIIAGIFNLPMSVIVGVGIGGALVTVLGIGMPAQRRLSALNQELLSQQEGDK